jgi:hypothetical protein
MPEPQLPLTGGCLCGGIRFEVDAPLVNASYCHCTRCQRRTGTAASAQGRLEPGSLRFVSGEDLMRAYDPGDGGFSKLFCSACGSSLFSRAPGAAEPGSVRLGVLDGDPGVRPSFRTHVGTAAVWEPLPDDGLPRYEAERT